MIVLTEDNFYLYAAQNYRNYIYKDLCEFEEDLNRIKYLKKLFTIYERKKELNINLILNHIIILYNSFDTTSCTRMLFFKLEDHHSFLKSILHFTGVLPNFILKLNDEVNVIDTNKIEFDDFIYQKMKDITKS